MASSKPNVREIYRQSADSVKLALELLGNQSAAEPPRIPPDSDLETMGRLMADIVAAHSSEPANDYRELVVSVAAWTGGACDKAFFMHHLVARPHGAFVVRKGLEVLHMLLHRDLRRRSLSNSESQIYYDFVRLTSGMAKPPKLSRSRSAGGHS